MPRMGASPARLRCINPNETGSPSSRVQVKSIGTPLGAVSGPERENGSEGVTKRNKKLCWGLDSGEVCSLEMQHAQNKRMHWLEEQEALVKECELVES